MGGALFSSERRISTYVHLYVVPLPPRRRNHTHTYTEARVREKKQRLLVVTPDIGGSPWSDLSRRGSDFWGIVLSICMAVISSSVADALRAILAVVPYYCCT